MIYNTLLVVSFFMTAATANGCCRGFNFVQFRRPNFIPYYETPSPCNPVYDDHDQCYHNSAIGMFPADSMGKFDSPVNHFLTSYMEPKPVSRKCVCSKSIPSHRMMSNVPRCYKRNYCHDPLVESIPIRSGLPCSQFGCGSFDDCGDYGSCKIPSGVYRQPAHHVVPLAVPASCIC